MFDPADLEPLTEALTDAGVPSSTDPVGLTVPGALVRPDGVTEGGLASTMVGVSVILVAPDAAVPEALVELGRLYGLALPVLNDLGGPADRSTFSTLTLPDQPPLPAMVVPLELLTTP